ANLLETIHQLTMKSSALLASIILTALLSLPFSAAAVDAKPDKTDKDVKTAAKAKPYPLKTCIVSGDKLGEMGDPYVFTYQGREIKMCCKNCRKDFDKNPAKFVKKLEAAEKKTAK